MTSFGPHLDLAVLNVLRVDEEDVVEEVQVLEQRCAHEPVEVRTGDEPVALSGGGHGGSHPPGGRPGAQKVQSLELEVPTR